MRQVTINIFFCFWLFSSLGLSSPQMQEEIHGGIWTPEQIGMQHNRLKALGLQIDPNLLSNPQSPLLKAVVNVGTCSGVLVSPDGLILTNYHCILDMIEHLDYPDGGFYAHNRQEEFIYPRTKVYLTESAEDVTEKIREGLEYYPSSSQRGQAIADRIKNIVLEAEAEDDSIIAEVLPFYRGESYQLIRKRVLQDIRLVYAPQSSIGNFGGNTDNWKWPNHAGDFAFIRAYVDQNGFPREYHYGEKHVPYHSPNHLKLSDGDLSEELQQGDFVLLAGFPRRTHRLHTYQEIAHDLEYKMPENIFLDEQLQKILSNFLQLNETFKIQLNPRLAFIENLLKNSKLSLEVLKKIDFKKKKKNFEEHLLEWIQEDVQRSEKYLPIIESMTLNYEIFISKGWENRNLERLFLNSFYADFIHLIKSAVSIVKMAQEREKADSEREHLYQEKNWRYFFYSETNAQHIFHRDLSLSAFALLIKRALSFNEIPAFIYDLIDVTQIKKHSFSYIKSQLAPLYDKTTLTNLNVRLDLFRNATLKDLQESDDPFIKLGFKFVEIQKSLDIWHKRVAGIHDLTAPLYVGAVRDFLASQDKMLPADANGGLRITFGHVNGYNSSTGHYHEAFTNIKTLKAKHIKNDPEFEVPEEILDFAGNQLQPVNVLASLDTTLGTSGSPVISAKTGKIVALSFDSMGENLHGDWFFDENVRSILVDSRYILWVLRYVDNASELLDELGVRWRKKNN